MFRTAALLALGLAMAPDTGPRGSVFDPSRLALVTEFQAEGHAWMAGPDGRYAGFYNASNELAIVDVPKRKTLGTLAGHVENTIHDGGWSDNGRFVAVATHAETVKVWDAPACKEIASLKPHPGYT